MKRYLILAIPLLLTASDPKLDLLAALNEATEIASATKLNIDKVPSTTTLLDRDFIEASGARTLYDLLRFIPGIELSRTPSGKEQIIIRGVKSSYRDKIKFLINGVEVTNNLYTNQFYYYSFPAELIERIEFTKTPDSVTYGNNAFMGVLNVITKQKPQLSYYNSTQNQHTFTLIAQKDFTDYSLKLDAYTTRSRPDLQSPSTYLIDTIDHTITLFRQSLPANTLQKSKGIGITLSNEHWTFQYRFHHYKKGNFFGISRLTPLIQDDSISFSHNFFQLSYHTFFNPNFKIETTLRYRRYLWDGTFRTFPYDLDPNAPAPYDLIIGAHIPEDEFFASTQLKYFGKSHTLTAIFDGRYAKPHDFYYIQYVPALSEPSSINLGPNKTALTGTYNALKEGIERKIVGLSLQDLFTISDNCSLTLGLRFDHYSDFGSKLSYKMGGVYNLERTTLKLLLNQAYRAPSWVELYGQSAAEFNGNEELDAEKITMAEAQLLHRFSEKDLLQTTLYYGYNDDTIDRYIDPVTGKRIYMNMGRLLIRGVEMSYTKFIDNHRLRLWIAYNNNKKKYRSSFLDNGLGYTRKWLANATLITAFDRLKIFSALLYGSPIQTLHTASIPSYWRFDQTFRYTFKNASVQFGVTNLFDHQNYTIATPSELIAERYLFVFQNGRLPEEGRTFFIRFTKRF